MLTLNSFISLYSGVEQGRGCMWIATETGEAGIAGVCVAGIRVYDGQEGQQQRGLGKQRKGTRRLRAQRRPCYFSAAVIECPDKEQLRGKRTCFVGYGFRGGTAHHGGERMVARAQGLHDNQEAE